MTSFLTARLVTCSKVRSHALILSERTMQTFWGLLRHSGQIFPPDFCCPGCGFFFDWVKALSQTTHWELKFEKCQKIEKCQIQSRSENRTLGFQTTPKTERFCVRFIDVRISAFYSIRLGKLSKIRTFERQRSDFKQKKVSEIRTKLFGFQTLLETNRNCNRTELICPKSELFVFRTLTVFNNLISELCQCV